MSSACSCRACNISKPGSILLIAIFALAAGAVPVQFPGEVQQDGVIYVRNSEIPSQGLVTLSLREIWRAGGEDDEILFGIINSALADENGNVYLLDRQLSEVHVYSPAGEHLRTLSREGEGPGEVQYPTSLLFTPDGALGLVQTFPGKIVKINLDGTPTGTVSLGGDDPSTGGFHFLSTAQCQNGHLLVCGSRMTPVEGTMVRIQYLAKIQEDGSETVRYLEKTSRQQGADFKWKENENYFVDPHRWTLGMDGRVYAATQRDYYQINVYGLDGELERVVEREFIPYKRTEEEKERVRQGIQVSINGREAEKEIADFAPCISSLQVNDDGNLWVLHSRSDHDLPDGIMMVYDIFDPEGHFLRQAGIACKGDAQEDRLFLLGSDRVILVRNWRSASLSRLGNLGQENAEGGEEVSPLEVICCEIEP